MKTLLKTIGIVGGIGAVSGVLEHFLLDKFVNKDAKEPVDNPITPDELSEEDVQEIYEVEPAEAEEGVGEE